MRIALATLAAFLVTMGHAPTFAGDTPKSTADIVQESEPSIALVKGKSSMGTGFLVRPGLLVTNAHVIDSEFVSGLEVAFPSADEAKKGPYPAELVYEDRKRDLAILAVKVDLPPLRMADAYTFRKGEDITVIGNPGVGGEVVLENAVSRGVMSTKAEIEGQKFYQMGVAINPGNSGGPVFDSQGRVIGVATLKSSKQEALAFSIPVEELKAAIDKAAAQKPADAEQAKSRHRAVVAVQMLSGGGALYSLGADLKRIAATPAGGASNEVKTASQTIDGILTELDKEAFPAIAPEMSQLKKDTLLSTTTRDKVTRLSDNFTKLRTTYRTKPGEQAKVKDSLKDLKDKHRQLITELSKDLKIEIPAQMMVAFDDHPTAPAGAIAGVVSGSSSVARVGPKGASSLRQRMQDRKTTTTNRAGSRGTTGSSARDRMKARRGNN